MPTITTYEHDCDDGTLPLADWGFTFYRSRFAGTPIWECDRCGYRATYVECGCDLGHYCDREA
jgi:hypothetical protein